MMEGKDAILKTLSKLNNSIWTYTNAQTTDISDLLALQKKLRTYKSDILHAYTYSAKEGYKFIKFINRPSPSEFGMLVKGPDGKEYIAITKVKPKIKK